MGPQDRLISYLDDQRGKCFDLGRHDCFTFTNGAWQAMYGVGYADGLIGRYIGLGPKGVMKLIKEAYGTPDIIDALDTNLTRITRFPPKGALVCKKTDRFYMTGYAFGIAVGVHGVFVGDLDMVYIPIEQIDGAWE